MTVSSGTCQQVWGDAVKHSSEAWDDSNTIAGDGWPSDCLIVEKGYTCRGGSATSPDTCLLNTEDEIFNGSPSSGAKRTKYILVFLMMVGVFFNSLSLFSNIGSFQSILSVANNLQLLLLLPLFKTHMPKPVIDFYKGISWAMFSFDFIDIKSIYEFSSFSKQQTDPYLFLIGVQDMSLIVNLTSLMMLMALIVCLHVVLVICYKKWKDREELNKVQKLTIKLFKMLTFNFYVRSSLQTFLFTTIVCTSHGYIPGFTHAHSYISFVLNISISFGLIGLVVLSIVEWRRLHNVIRIEEVTYFSEFFAGLKDDNKSRLLNVANLIRKTLLVVWLIMFPFVARIAAICVFSIIQLAYSIFLVWICPFLQKRDNVKEIFNELSFLTFSVFHWFCHSDATWNDTLAQVNYSFICRSTWQQSWQVYLWFQWYLLVSILSQLSIQSNLVTSANDLYKKWKKKYEKKSKKLTKVTQDPTNFDKSYTINNTSMIASTYD